MAGATAYQGLLRKYTPRLIRNEREYKRALRHVDDLMKRSRRSRAEGELLDLMAHLIAQYEESIDPTPDVPPRRILAHLIESRGATAADVSRATGIHRSTLSAVLAGRREISKANVAKLSRYFGVSPVVFFGLDD